MRSVHGRSICSLCVMLLAVSRSPALTNASIQARTAVTVLLDYDEPGFAPSFVALQSELSNILNDSHIQIHLKLRSDAPEYAQFDDLVLFRMRGTCSMAPLPVAALSDERGPLALTHAVNGELLPFGEVHCDRVRDSVRRTLKTRNPAAQEPELGIALARVMAHELYHMMAHSAVHTHSGVTKAALSSQELTGDKLGFTPQAQRMLKKH